METSSSSDIFLSPFSDMDLSSSSEIELSSSENELTSSSPDVVILKNFDSDLTKLVAKHLDVSDCAIFHKTNAETMAAIADLVRGKDIYIIQMGTKDANNNIMELLIKACACKTSSPRSIVAVIPYLPYLKECKMLKRGCIVTKLLSTMLSTSGLSHVITMDLYQKEIQDFLKIPVDNLSANSSLMQYIKGSIPDYRNAVIVSCDQNSTKKAKSFADKLRLKIAIIHGEQKEVGIAQKKVANSKSGAADDPYKKELNKVESKIAVIVLDAIETDSYQGLKKVALKLKDYGASAVYVLATHYCLEEIPSRDFLSCEHIYKVVVSNTLPIEHAGVLSDKLKVIDVSEAFAGAMRNTKKQNSKDNRNSKAISELMCDLSLNK